MTNKWDRINSAMGGLAALQEHYNDKRILNQSWNEVYEQFEIARNKMHSLKSIAFFDLSLSPEEQVSRLESLCEVGDVLKDLQFFIDNKITIRHLGKTRAMQKTITEFESMYGTDYVQASKIIDVFTQLKYSLERSKEHSKKGYNGRSFGAFILGSACLKHYLSILPELPENIQNHELIRKFKIF